MYKKTFYKHSGIKFYSTYILNIEFFWDLSKITYSIHIIELIQLNLIFSLIDSFDAFKISHKVKNSKKEIGHHKRQRESERVREVTCVRASYKLRRSWKTTKGGKRWSKRQTTCIIDVLVSPASLCLFSSLLLSSHLFSSLYLSLPLRSSEYLRLPSRPPLIWKHSCESSSFRYIPPGERIPAIVSVTRYLSRVRTRVHA